MRVATIYVLRREKKGYIKKCIQYSCKHQFDLRKLCPCNLDPIRYHFLYRKLGFIGIYINEAVLKSSHIFYYLQVFIFTELCKSHSI